MLINLIMQHELNENAIPNNQPQSQNHSFALEGGTDGRYATLPCADCGCIFAPAVTKTRLCLTCISKKNDITDGIPRQLNIQWCRYCHRYFGNNWILCDRESKELLNICMKKITGLKFMKLMNAHFLWSEAHSKRLKIRLTVQKQINGQVTLEQTFDVEFVEIYTQCDDCKKDFTPHTWKAMVQVRQKAISKKTFLYLEQLMLKNTLHKKCIKITSMPEGMDFFFKNKANAQTLVDFISALVPTIKRESKELISHNSKENTYNYKYTIYLELPKVCKDDLVILPKKLCNEVGGTNALAICYKVGSAIHMFDPITFKVFFINANMWFSYENDIKVIPFKTNESEFYVVDIYKDQDKKVSFNNSFSNIEIRFAHIEVRRASDNQEFTSITQLGHILKHGDTVLGYDLTALNSAAELATLENQKYIPDVLIIRKTYPKGNRIWKLKRMEVEEGLELAKPTKKQKQAQEEGDKDLKDFCEEIEQNKFLRSKMNLYRVS